MTLTEFYTKVWKSEVSVTEEELETLLSRAADVIDSSIYLSGTNVENVSDNLQERVYKAVCAQADYIDSCGGVDSMNESSGGSVSLGNYSYSAGAVSANSAESYSCRLCSQAEFYLLPTGLLYKGVDVF